MTTKATTPADVARLCELMVKHDLVELQVGDVHLRRAPAPPKAADGSESPLQQLARLSPDAQERALMLGRVGPGGA